MNRNEETTDLFPRAHSDYQNPNTCIISGVPGSGKNFLVKQEIVKVLTETDDVVCVVGLDNEFKDFKANCKKWLKISDSKMKHFSIGS